MKNIKFFLLLLTTFSYANAQTEEGSVMFEGYFAFPNFLKVNATNKAKNLIQKSTLYVNQTGLTSYTIKQFGPVGLRAERLLTYVFGIGLDVSYRSASIKQTYNSDWTNQANNGFIDYTFTQTDFKSKLKIMATFNFHFLEDDRMDAYTVFGAGYTHKVLKTEVTDLSPGIEPSDVKRKNFFESNSFDGDIDIFESWPVALRLGAGFRYFLTSNLGLNGAIGIGGTVLSFGLTYKLQSPSE